MPVGANQRTGARGGESVSSVWCPCISESCRPPEVTSGDLREAQLTLIPTVTPRSPGGREWTLQGIGMPMQARENYLFEAYLVEIWRFRLNND